LASLLLRDELIRKTYNVQRKVIIVGRHSRFDPRLNHRGVAMVTVLLIMLVLTILTTGVVVIAVANFNQSSTTVDHKQSYYVAEAGINYQVKSYESTVATLVGNGSTAAQISAGIDTWIASAANTATLDTVGGLARTYTTSVNRSGNNINIISTGTVGSVSRTLSKRIRLAGLIIDKAILTSGELNVNKTDVFLDASGNYGPIQSLSNADDAVSIDKLGKVSEVTIPTPIPPKTFVDVIDGCTPVGPISDMTCQTGSYTYKVIYDDSITSLPAIIIPATPTVNTSTDKLAPIRVTGKSTWLVANNGVVTINSNSVNAGYTYTLATSNSTKTKFYASTITITNTINNFGIDIGSKNIEIVTNTLNLNGSFKIIGTGTLTIYVPLSGFKYNCGNGSICGVKGNTNPYVADQFKIIVTGSAGSILNLSNNTGDFYMTLLTNSNVNLTMKGNGTFNGFLATSGSSISFSGTSQSHMLLYAPNAVVDIQGNASISGAIIGESYQNLNSASTDVTFNPLFASPPFDFLYPYSNVQFDPTVEN